MTRLKRLLVAYGLAGVTALVAYHGSIWLSGKLHPHSTFSIGGKRVVEEVQVSLYGEEVWWYSIMLFLLATVWALREDDGTAYKSRWEYLFTSKKLNTMVGVLFIFAALGLVFSKTAQFDPVVTAVFLFNLTTLAVIFVRFIARETYLRRITRTGLASKPTSGSGRAISS